MKIRVLEVKEKGKVDLLSDPKPESSWCKDGVIRWVNVEHATKDELVDLLDNLNSKGEFIADLITGDNWYDWIEQDDFFVKANAAPTAWFKDEKWYHLVRPGPDHDMNSVMVHVVRTFIDEEAINFYRLRLEIEEHSEGLKQGDKKYTVAHLEALMTKCQHMLTVFYEYQVLAESLEFNLSIPISAESLSTVYRSKANLIKTFREGVEYLKQRLVELHNQHLMDQQGKTESRIRVLTIISAIFMPLTLIAGIYGMNFQNMPELDDTYAYFIVLAVMLTVAITMLGFFYKKGWFK
jgi:magnesium transporter